MADDVGMMRTKPYAGGRLSTGQAAEILGCSITHLHSVPKAVLDYVKVGNRRRYRPEDVERYRALQAEKQ